ncbi:hypothetical protein QQP08_001771 [Theobroma cacao]|nr:hypothetical protein QQP08_001771 [Theobroma cacao]
MATIISAAPFQCTFQRGECYIFASSFPYPYPNLRQPKRESPFRLDCQKTQVGIQRQASVRVTANGRPSGIATTTIVTAAATIRTTAFKISSTSVLLPIYSFFPLSSSVFPCPFPRMLRAFEHIHLPPLNQKKGMGSWWYLLPRGHSRLSCLIHPLAANIHPKTAHLPEFDRLSSGRQHLQQPDQI